MENVEKIAKKKTGETVNVSVLDMDDFRIQNLNKYFSNI